MGSPMEPSHLSFSDLESQGQDHSYFETSLVMERSDIGPILLLNINRKHILFVYWCLTLSDLERSKSFRY